MASWEMQIQVINCKTREPEWVSITCSGEMEPYRYASQYEAELILEGLYPDILSDHLRVVQVPNQPNIGKGVRK